MVGRLAIGDHSLSNSDFDSREALEEKPPRLSIMHILA